MKLPTAALRQTGCVLSLLLSLVAGSAGCGGHHNVEDEPEADPDAPTPLTVTNNNWLDVVVYVFHDGEATRVATVTAATTANYFLPPWMLGHSRTIRLIGHAVGSNGNISTELIHIQPGQFIEWRLESDLSRSSVAVY
ncbi:MAG: hypothetical protein ACM3NS_02660 [Deltaproteobacteria bacterium]